MQMQRETRQQNFADIGFNKITRHIRFLKNYVFIMIRHNSSLEQYVICELVLGNYDSNIIQISQDLVSESLRSSYAVIQPLSHF